MKRAETRKASYERDREKRGYPDLKLYTPIELGQITDFTLAQKMFQILLDRHLGRKKYFSKRGEGLLVLHEEYSAVGFKPYYDLMYLVGYKEIHVVDEHVVEKTDSSSWEDVIWAMKETKQKIRSAIEITKEDTQQYAKYALEQFLKKYGHWGISGEEIKDWF